MYKNSFAAAYRRVPIYEVMKANRELEVYTSSPELLWSGGVQTGNRCDDIFSERLGPSERGVLAHHRVEGTGQLASFQARE